MQAISREAHLNYICFSLKALQDLVAIARTCHSSAFFIELERLTKSANQPGSTLPLPVIMLPRKHREGACKMYIHANLPSGTHCIFFEPGHHTAFCKLAYQIYNALKTSHYADLLHEQGRTDLTRRSDAHANHVKASIAMKRLRQDLTRLLRTSFDLLSDPNQRADLPFPRPQWL